MNLTKSKILVTGGTGFLGKALIKQLLENGVPSQKIVILSSKDYDLRIPENCAKVTKGMDVIIHLAANVGGIGYNQKFPGSLFYDNAVMGLHMIEEARKANVKKFVAIGTVCAYPKFTPVPFQEDNLWNGYPEETNAPYGLAKKMLLVQCQAYAKQYNMNAIYLLPVNLYGPNDNFNPLSSHVIPALIKKFVEGKKNDSKQVSIWGTGNATREFLFVTDAAKGIIMATEKYSSSEPVNIGSSQEISIYQLAHTIAQIVEYKGKIVFDKTKPDGQPKRKLDVSKAEKHFNFKSETDFKTGLKKTINWYIENQTLPS